VETLRSSHHAETMSKLGDWHILDSTT